jgi:[acyl-carrier-protein] S-malonyltransferase
VRVAMVFPGQGTQAPGMGASWQDHPAWKLLEQAEGALGEPLRHLVLDAPAEQLARTRDAQLAVLCTSLVAWEALRPLVDDVVAFAGHSLGQVSALVASGALDLEDGVRFAARRAELTQRAADDHPGRMAALLGATVEQAAEACDAAPEAAWIANDNAPGQVVIAGTAEGLELATARAKELGVKRATALNVGGAFHTPLMASAAAGISEALRDVHFGTPMAAIVANQDGGAYFADDTWDGDSWRERSAAHVTVPVLWRPSMETLAALGADAFVEVGYGSMIAGLAKRTVPGLPVFSCADPSDLDNLAKELAS